MKRILDYIKTRNKVKKRRYIVTDFLDRYIEAYNVSVSIEEKESIIRLALWYEDLIESINFISDEVNRIYHEEVKRYTWIDFKNILTK